MLILFYFVCFGQKIQTTQIEEVEKILKKADSDSVVIIDCMDLVYEYENALFSGKNKQLRSRYLKKHNISREKYLKVLNSQKLNLNKILMKIIDFLICNSVKIVGISAKNDHKTLLAKQEQIFKEQFAIKEGYIHKGIIYTRNEKFLNSMKHKKIILISNSEKLIEKCEKFCEKNKITFLGVHYNKCFLEEEMDEIEMDRQVKLLFSK